MRRPTDPSMSAEVPWRKHLYTVYLTGSLIMVRCIFRLVEYVTGTKGYIWQHEAFSYVFDSSLMWFVMVIFAVNHPSEIRAIITGQGKVVQGLRMKSHASSVNSTTYELQPEAGENPEYRWKYVVGKFLEWVFINLEFCIEESSYTSLLPSFLRRYLSIYYIYYIELPLFSLFVYESIIVNS